MNFLSLYKRYIKFILKKKINIDTQPDFKDKKLEDLFIYYGTDKGQTWKNKENIGHGYTQFYEKHFEQIRSKKLNILEIGSYAGASAASFKKYFYNSNIYCLDVNISNFKFSSKNIQVFGIDVSNQKKIMKFFKKIGADKTSFFDIIIDDGSHKLSDILLSLNIFIHKLNKDGYYVIEDFKLPNFHEHLNDVDEDKIDKLFEKIKLKKSFSSKILDQETLSLLKNNFTIDDYKGNLKESDIIFLKKLN